MISKIELIIYRHLLYGFWEVLFQSNTNRIEKVSVQSILVFLYRRTNHCLAMREQYEVLKSYIVYDKDTSLCCFFFFFFSSKASPHCSGTSHRRTRGIFWSSYTSDERIFLKSVSVCAFHLIRFDAPWQFSSSICHLEKFAIHLNRTWMSSTVQNSLSFNCNLLQ